MRLRLLTLMCHVALVDGVEDKAETQLIGEFAAAFGFPPSWMNQVRQSVVARQPKKAGKAPATKEKGAARPEQRVGALAGAHRQRRLLRRLREPLPPLSPRRRGPSISPDPCMEGPVTAHHFFRCYDF